MIRVTLPYHLRNLARVDGEVSVEVEGVPTVNSVIDALETTFPAIRGTLRDYATGKRRPMVRFFACGKDISLADPDSPLPEAVVSGEEPFHVIGAIAGG